MVDWTATSGFDVQSATCSPQFAGHGDFHLTSPEGLTVAHPLDYAGFDIDGEERSNTPCAGADEYNEIYVIGESEKEKILSVYPNPTQGVVSISMDDALDFEYQLFDFTGKSVMNGKKHDHTMTLDLSGFSKGIYLISVISESKCLTQKVIVR